MSIRSIGLVQRSFYIYLTSREFVEEVVWHKSVLIVVSEAFKPMWSLCEVFSRKRFNFLTLLLSSAYLQSISWNWQIGNGFTLNLMNLSCLTLIPRPLPDIFLLPSLRSHRLSMSAATFGFCWYGLGISHARKLIVFYSKGAEIRKGLARSQINSIWSCYLDLQCQISKWKELFGKNECVFQVVRDIGGSTVIVLRNISKRTSGRRSPIVWTWVAPSYWAYPRGRPGCEWANTQPDSNWWPWS
jgi:hypothetical protein